MHAMILQMEEMENETVNRMRWNEFEGGQALSGGAQEEWGPGLESGRGDFCP